MIRVLLVDDQQLVREGLRRILHPDEGFEIAGECGDGGDVADAVARLHPDVVVMDVRMKDVDGVEATRRLRVEPDAPPVLVLTTFDDDEVLSGALRAGAAGFVLKDAPGEELIRSARTVAAGDAWLDPAVTGRVLATYRSAAPARDDGAAARIDELTPRERDVLRLVGRGASNTEIAESLFVSEATVKSHIGHIFTKLDLRDRAAAIVFAFDHGLVAPQSSASSAGPQRPQAVHHGGEGVEEGVDVLGRRAPADADAQRVVGVDTHGRQDRRRLERLARARRARVHRHAPLVEPEQDRLRLDALDAEADEMRHPIDGIAVERHAADPLRRLVRDAVGELALRTRFGGEPTVGGSSAAAAPKPTMAGTSSSPPRRARSCAPPTTNGGSRRPRRTSSAPAPFGPPNLCALTEHRSAPRAPKSTGTCPAAMHASTWTSTPRSRHAAATAPRAGSCRPRGWRAAR